MTTARWSLPIFLLFAAQAFAADAKPQYFTQVRDVHVMQPGTQFVALDADIWSHTRTDLGDIRLYDGTRELPYALREQGSVEYTEQREVRLLNKGIVPGATQFLLDMYGVDVYDQLTLEIDQRDFDRQATVEGANTADASTWTTLTTAPIFDFSKQKLGENLAISLPTSTFRYLRVSISNKGLDHGNDVLPAQVTGAKACNTLRTSAVWDDAGVSIPHATNPHDSDFRLEIPKGVPVDRIHFTVPPELVNFRREVTVEMRPDDRKFKSDDEGWRPITTGEISRVRSMGGKIHDNLDISTHDTLSTHLRVTIENGDDPPLPVQLTAQSVERRIYFDPRGASVVRLYYGDDKLGQPVYDFEKFFHDTDAKTAVPAKMGVALDNPEFAARPDERPWTERHGWVLWAAMIAAVLGIGMLALRGLKRA